MINPEEYGISTTALCIAPDPYRGFWVHESCAPGRTCGQCRTVTVPTTMHDLIIHAADVSDSLQVFLEGLWGQAVAD